MNSHVKQHGPATMTALTVFAASMMLSPGATKARPVPAARGCTHVTELMTQTAPDVGLATNQTASPFDWIGPNQGGGGG